MTLILLEALGAGLLLALIVWWTMFSGRDGGEPQPDDPPAPAPQQDDAPLAEVPASPSAQARPHDAKE